jgi:glycosyltransferase involved in cell wall biosynthesis
MKIVEYMAMGKPVVAPAMDNIRDLIEDGRTGLLFAPEDGSALVDRLETLILSPDRRLDIGRAARQAVERSLNWGHNAMVVESAARRLLAAH